MMSCTDTRKLLQTYLDRELSEEEVAAVRGHLSRCGSCGDCYRFEADLRRLIRSCGARPPIALRLLRRLLPLRSGPPAPHPFLCR